VKRQSLTPRDLLRDLPDAPAKQHLPDLLAPGLFTDTAWEKPDGLTDSAWLDIGRTLASVESATPWWWADWYRSALDGWLALLSSDDWRGPLLHTLQNYASTAKAFPVSRRREGVSLAHHAELAGLATAEQDKLLDWCAETKPTVVELREEKRRRASVTVNVSKPKPFVDPPPIPLPLTSGDEEPDTASAPPTIEHEPEDGKLEQGVEAILAVAARLGEAMFKRALPLAMERIG
jgi:hypothetical protein